jgi:undecaprenyl-diphosphatase
MDSVFIVLATYATAAPVALIVMQFFFESRQEKVRFVFIALIACTLALLMEQVATHLYFHPRPFVAEGFTPLVQHVADNSFPSRHALFAGVLAAISTVFSRRFGIWMWILAIGIGAGRVYVGVHYPIDIIVSFGIAILSTIAAFFAIAKWKSSRS